MKRRQDSIDSSDNNDHINIIGTTSRISTKRQNYHVLLPTPYYRKPFKQLRRISKGSHSSCYEIEHPNGDIFAMKVINLDEPRSRQLARGGSKRTSSRAIMREIQIQKLACNTVGKRNSGGGGDDDVTGRKNIVTFCGELRLFNDGPIRVGLVLEYCPNGSLYGYITSRGLVLREWEARRVLLQLCGGVAWLHKRHIVHGDLKLSNLLLDSRCDLKICDFGHSFVVVNEDLGVSSESCLDIAGTPNYLAPEVVECLMERDTGNKQHESLRRISYEIDIWAIGVCLYAMLIGTPPFQIDFSRAATTTTLEDLYRRIRQVEYAYPPSDSISVSDSVKRLIKDILVSEPYGRLSLLEIVADKWLRESYFPDKLSLGVDNVHFDKNFDNGKSILNFKKCLIKSGFRQSLIGINNKGPFGKKNRGLTNRDHVKLRGTATLDTEAVSKTSLLRQQIDKTLEELSKEARSRRLERLQRWLPLGVRYTTSHTSGRNRDNKVASQILTSHRRLTLTTLIEYELTVKFGVQSGPQYTITTSSASFSSGDTSDGGDVFVVASRVSTDDNGSFIYKLSDGSLGLLSSDTAHTVLVNRQAKRMWYIIPDNETGWLGKCFDLNQENLFPEELSNRLATAEMSANSLESSSLDYFYNSETNGSTPQEDIFVRGFTLFEDKFDTKFFELSDGSFQFEFSDREYPSSTTVLLRNNGKLVTTISSTTGVCEQWPLWEFLQQCRLDARMMDMFQHMKRCLTEQ